MALFTSSSETHLANAAINLCIPREYIPLILISKEVLDPKFVDDNQLSLLGAKPETIKKRNAADFEFSQWIKLLRDDVIANDEGLV